jgi:hypothetical protein
VPEDLDAWGTMPVESLIALLQSTTKKLVTQFEEVAVDEGAYHRKFWTVWQTLREDAAIAAKNRECELCCKELREQVILAESIREGLLAKRDALVAVLAARTK